MILYIDQEDEGWKTFIETVRDGFTCSMDIDCVIICIMKL